MSRKRHIEIILMLLLGLLWAGTGRADIFIQCPADTDGIDTDGDGDPNDDVVCMHIVCGDGFVNMASDDRPLTYIFGFSDVTGVPADQVMDTGMLNANFPSPTIVLKEGQKFYLGLSNSGMMMRPDLFDAHTVHFHGFPNAASVYDGVPDASISINMGATFTYFYDIVEPGTYIYHCHFEAAEHMQMGMLGNLYVLPIQDNLPNGTNLNGFTHHTGYKYLYNDGDGSSYYDVDYPIQISGFDPKFHEADMTYQPLPFAAMDDTYPMLNGRGYPDTVDTNVLYNTAFTEMGVGMMNRPSQKINSLITATQGQKVALRISSLSTTSFRTLGVLGIPMRVVGIGARLLRGPNGQDTSYMTTSVDLGGGETIDVILDTTDVPPGTYPLYCTNLDQLSNNNEDYGGMMTEIRITEP